MIKRIHHINFMVKDLGKAVQSYSVLFGDPAHGIETLASRGIKLARYKVGETWLILIQPIADGVPAQHLEKHGEGFFLISCQVDDVGESAAKVAAQGIRVMHQQARQGLDDWQVMDLSSDDLFGANFQLVESHS